MGETPEEQRIRLARKRLETSEYNLIQCLECPLKFVRVGSHVVQVHGYENVAEYRKEHGLMAKETRVSEYAKKMSEMASTYENLEAGSHARFKKGGGHGEVVSEFWKNRKKRR